MPRSKVELFAATRQGSPFLPSPDRCRYQSRRRRGPRISGKMSSAPGLLARVERSGGRVRWRPKKILLPLDADAGSTHTRRGDHHGPVAHAGWHRHYLRCAGRGGCAHTREQGAPRRTAGSRCGRLMRSGRRTRLLTHHCLLIDTDPSPALSPCHVTTGHHRPSRSASHTPADFEIRCAINLMHHRYVPLPGDREVDLFPFSGCDGQHSQAAAPGRGRTT